MSNLHLKIKHVKKPTCFCCSSLDVRSTRTSGECSPDPTGIYTLYHMHLNAFPNNKVLLKFSEKSTHKQMMNSLRSLSVDQLRFHTQNPGLDIFDCRDLFLLLAMRKHTALALWSSKHLKIHLNCTQQESLFSEIMTGLLKNPTNLVWRVGTIFFLLNHTQPHN